MIVRVRRRREKKGGPRVEPIRPREVRVRDGPCGVEIYFEMADIWRPLTNWKGDQRVAEASCRRFENVGIQARVYFLKEEQHEQEQLGL